MSAQTPGQQAKFTSAKALAALTDLPTKDALAVIEAFADRELTGFHIDPFYDAIELIREEIRDEEDMESRS